MYFICLHNNKQLLLNNYYAIMYLLCIYNSIILSLLNLLNITNKSPDYDVP